MSNRDRIFAFLQSIHPNDASNEEISSRTGIRPHQQVFMITRDLARAGLIREMLAGKEWRFRAHSTNATASQQTMNVVTEQATPKVSPREFEQLAATVLSRHFGTRLQPGRVPGVPKLFDLVSTDGQIVGDAKFYTLVQGERLPPAKFSIIAEHVWLLEKAPAKERFLVFGNDRRVPEQWLKRYGELSTGVAFFFLDGTGALQCISS